MRVALVRRSECVPNSVGSSPMLAIHSDTNRAYCLVVMPRPDPRRPGKRNSPGFLFAALILIDRLARLLRHFEPHGSAGLLLPDSCSIDRASTRCNILDLESDDIAAPQLAVDGEVEHRQVSGTPVNLELGTDRPD